MRRFPTPRKPPNSITATRTRPLESASTSTTRPRSSPFAPCTFLPSTHTTEPSRGLTSASVSPGEVETVPAADDGAVGACGCDLELGRCFDCGAGSGGRQGGTTIGGSIGVSIGTSMLGTEGLSSADSGGGAFGFSARRRGGGGGGGGVWAQG